MIKLLGKQVAVAADALMAISMKVAQILRRNWTELSLIERARSFSRMKASTWVIKFLKKKTKGNLYGKYN
jgi:hypothetical protein